MKRMGLVIGVKPDRIAEYKRIYAAVWPGNPGENFRRQHPQLHDISARAREPAVRLLGISRRRLGRRRRKDEGRSLHAGLVGDHRPDAGAAGQSKGGRMVGDGRGSVSSRLTPVSDAIQHNAPPLTAVHTTFALISTLDRLDAGDVAPAFPRPDWGREKERSSAAAGF